MSRVTGFHHAGVLVSDTDRALAFYHGVLGLALVPRPALDYPGAWLDLGQGQQLHLLELAGAGSAQRDKHGGRDAHLALYVDDLDAVAVLLDAAAIPVTRSRSGRRALFCRDPDGNALELVAAG